MTGQTDQIRQQVQKAISGKDEIIDKVLMVILAGGHILLEGVPGVGKTTLALAFSRAMGMSFQRVQFTPDVVPSDITGFTMYEKETGEFTYKPGAAMCNLLLADETNRTSSKTQSALLEVMQEGCMTVDGEKHPVPQPFIVIATQNPLGTAGTQKLPEAQLDRFMVQLAMGYPSFDAQVSMLENRENVDPLTTITRVVSADDILHMRQDAASVYIHKLIYEYVTRLTEATRNSEYLHLGLSPRAAIALCSMARAHAYMAKRDYVIPVDIQDIFIDCARHRIILSPKAQLENKSAEDVLREILANTPGPVPGGGK